MLNLNVLPDDLWDYFQKHKKDLGNKYHIVAEIIDGDITTQVLLTEENGYPSISIEESDGITSVKVVAHDCAISKDDCCGVARKLYNLLEKYKPSDKSEDKGYENPEVLDLDDVDIEIIEEREAQLCSSLRTFIKEAMGFEEEEDFEMDPEEEIVILDSIEEFLTGLGYTFFRPRIIEIDGVLKVVSSIEDELMS